MNSSDGAPPISKDKARRLGLEKPGSRHLTKILVAVIVIMMVSVAGAYAYSSMLRSHSGSTTTTAIGPPGASTSVTAVSTILPETFLSLQCGPNPQMVQAPVRCTATVAAKMATSGVSGPTGSVVFDNMTGGKFGVMSCSSSGSSLACTVIYTPSSASEGTQVLTAHYAGDSAHGSSGAQFALQVTKRPTATSIICSPQIVPVNVGATCKLAVSDVGNGTSLTPGGTVSFYQATTGSYSSPTCTLSSGSCTATFTAFPGSEGRISLSASYSGDGDHINSKTSGSNVLTAIRRASNSTVTCNPSSAAVGTKVACAATVLDTSAGAPLSPTGDFAFYVTVGSSTSNPATCHLVFVNNSAASCGFSFTQPSSGQTSEEIWGMYTSDHNHRESTAPGFNLQTKALASRTSLTCNANSVPVGSLLDCTATVSSVGAGSQVEPTGSVSFASTNRGSFSTSSCTLSSGSCTVVFTPYAGSEGSATITASYTGDLYHGPSSAGASFVIVQRASSVAVSCDQTSVPVNSQTTCTARVSDATGSGTPSIPTGTVSFGGAGGTFDSGDSCQLFSGYCSVTFTPSPGSEGPINITAAFSGDGDHSASASAPFGITAITRGVTVTVSCSPTSVVYPASTTCTATATDTDKGSAILPTGTVTFSASIGGTFSGTSCTLVSGSCSVTWTPPIAVLTGTTTITADYSGDIDHAGGAGTTTVQY